MRRARSGPLPAAVVLGLVLTGCGSSQGRTTGTAASTPGRPTTVDVSTTDCGSTWRPGSAGDQDLRLHNADQNAGEVQVVGRGTNAGLVYADVEPFGPGTTVDVHVSLAAGRYALACLMEDQVPATGPTRAITGAGDGAGTPGVRILTQSQLVPSALAYQGWVRRHLVPLERDTRRLRDRVDAGDRSAAQRAWLTAHLDYQRLGAAYDAFGDLGDTIDGLPAGIPGGTSSPRWTGFHRVERDLWGSAAPARLRTDVDVLVRAVDRLPGELGSTQLDPLTLTLRAHEIAENALQFQLTGQDDFGSHTDLDSVRAELVGTGVVLRALATQIDARVRGAGHIRASLRRTLAAFTRATRGGTRVPVDRLPRREREQLDASLSLLTQRLAAIPATLEPRLTVSSQSLSSQSVQGAGRGAGR